MFTIGHGFDPSRRAPQVDIIAPIARVGMNGGEGADHVHAGWELESFCADIQRAGHGAGGLDHGREWGRRAESLVLFDYDEVASQPDQTSKYISPSGLGSVKGQTYEDGQAALESRICLCVGHCGAILRIVAYMLDLFRNPLLDLRICRQVSDHVCQGDGDGVMAGKVEDEDIAKDFGFGQAEIGAAPFGLAQFVSLGRSGAIFRGTDHGANKIPRIRFSLGNEPFLLCDNRGDVRLEGARRLTH